MFLLKHFAKAHFAKAMMLGGGLAFLLLPVPSPVPALVQRLDAQAFPGRLRRPPMPPGEAPPPPGAQTSAPVPVPAPAAPQPAVAVPQPTAALPPSMLQQPAQPATIRFTAQSLSIHADNSSLRDILHQLSQQTGMDVQGFGNNDERVFGTFGPGDPEDVVSDLLNGTPYNVLMVGVLTNGAPRQLVLSPASHLAASVAPSNPPPPAKDDNDDQPANDAQQPPPQAEPLQNPNRDRDQRDQPSPQPAPSTAPTVKSPQELFQQLQQLREQQQEQRQGQQGQQPQQQQQQPPQQ